MAAKAESGDRDLEQTLKPFHDRATEAEVPHPPVPSLTGDSQNLYHSYHSSIVESCFRKERLHMEEKI
jgi:hypothetical protein